MSLYNLPRGGQLQMHGSIVNVPVDIAPVVRSLPRTLDDAVTIPIQLKRKISYKSSVWKQNVRPKSVLAALHFLMQKELYKTANLDIDEHWLDEMVNFDTDLTYNKDVDEVMDSDSDSDGFSEIDPDENVSGNLDTMLDEQDPEQFRTLSFSPGEGQHPLNLFQDKDAEYFLFPQSIVVSEWIQSLLSVTKYIIPIYVNGNWGTLIEELLIMFLICFSKPRNYRSNK